MSTSDTIVFFHAPNTRSSGARILLDELGAPHELRVVNMKAGEQRKPAFLAVNPMGKVPAILHRGGLVTEQVAIFIYLADLFPQAGLTPGVDDLNAMTYGGRAHYWIGDYVKLGVTDRAHQHETGDKNQQKLFHCQSLLPVKNAAWSRNHRRFGRRLPPQLELSAPEQGSLNGRSYD